MILQLLKNSMTQSILKIFYLKKKQIIPSSSSSTKKSKLKIIRNVVPSTGYKSFENQLSSKQKKSFIKKKQLALRFHEWIFWTIRNWNPKMWFFLEHVILVNYAQIRMYTDWIEQCHLYKMLYAHSQKMLHLLKFCD